MTTVHLIGGKAQKEHFNPNHGDEVWGLNACWHNWVGDRWTRFFNLHKHENLKRYNYDVDRNVQWLVEHPAVLLYTIDTWPELKYSARQKIWNPLSIASSIRDLHSTKAKHGYHCGSFDWLVAFALSQPWCSHIMLHGVSLLIEAGEPISARACLEYWCGVAEGAGVGVSCAPDCDLFSFYHLVKSNMVYGYDDTPIYEDRTKVADVPYKLPDPVQ